MRDMINYLLSLKGDIELITTFYFIAGLMAAILFIIIVIAIMTNVLEIEVLPAVT